MNSHEFVECEATGNTQQKSEPQALPDTTRRKISGIYGLRCRATNKWYVGQSTNILKRWNAYKWLMCKKQPKLYRALMKHGYDNFDKLVLERVDQNMDEREQYWIQYYTTVSTMVTTFRWEEASRRCSGGDIPKKRLKKCHG